jgi:phosphohistidine phosphatase
MKRLSLLRHAKSSWDDPGLEDFNRPLNERGWKAARRMGRELKHRAMHFDFVLASSAARVRETIGAIEEKYDFAAPIRFEPRVYLATEEILLSLVQSLPETAGSALIVGHNPGLERICVELTHDDEQGLRQRVAGKFPTAAFAAIELPVKHWADVTPGAGELVELIVPKDLD